MAYITIETNTDEGLVTLRERVVPSDMESESIVRIWSSVCGGPSRTPTALRLRKSSVVSTAKRPTQRASGRMTRGPVWSERRALALIVTSE